MKKLKIIVLCTIVLLIIVSTSAEADYTLQVGKFNYYNNAVKLKNSFSQAGYTTYMTSTRPYYVTVGKFPDLKEAAKVQQVFAQKNIPYFLKNFEDFNFPAVIGKNNIDIHSYSQFPLSNDLNLVGAFSGQTFFFYLNENWHPTGACFLDLTFSHSEVASRYNSNITIYLNDQPIKSIKLSNDQLKNRNVRVSLPKEYLYKNYNSLHLKVYKRISDLPCEDLFNQANWLTVNKNTYIHIEYEEKKDNLNIEQFPYPYLKSGRENPVDTILVIPKEANKNHLTAAAYMAFNLGMQERFTDIRTQVQQGIVNTASLSNANLIMFGEDKYFPNLPKELSATVDNNLIIQEFHSPWNKNKKVLRIIGQDTNLPTLIKFLFDNNLVKQMKREKQVFNMKDISLIKLEEDLEQISFAQLGYNDIVLKGVYQQNASINYSMPEGWRLKEGAAVKLDFRFSEALEFERSVVTVNVNGIPIGSKRLKRENATRDIANFLIPPELFSAKSLNIEVNFFFDMRNIDCTKRYEDQAWAVINKESSIFLPHERTSSMLNSYQDRFFEGSTLKDFALVIPENFSNIDLKRACSVFAFLGHYGKNIENAWLITENKLDENYQKLNLMIIASPEEEVFKRLNDHLWVKYSYENRMFLPNNDFPFLKELSKEAGLLQLITSPYSDKSIIIATAADEKLLENTDYLLFYQNYIFKREGVVSIIDNYGEVYNFQPPAVKEESNEGKVEKKVEGIKSFLKIYDQRNIIIIGSLMVLSIFALIIAFIFYSKSRKQI